MLTCYKKNRVILYYENQKNRIHFTTDSHFEEYLHLRKNTPKGCVIFSLKRDMEKAVDSGILDHCTCQGHLLLRGDEHGKIQYVR